MPARSQLPLRSACRCAQLSDTGAHGQSASRTSVLPPATCPPLCLERLTCPSENRALGPWESDPKGGFSLAGLTVWQLAQPSPQRYQIGWLTCIPTSCLLLTWPFPASSHVAALQGMHSCPEPPWVPSPELWLPFVGNGTWAHGPISAAGSRGAGAGGGAVAEQGDPASPRIPSPLTQRHLLLHPRPNEPASSPPSCPLPELLPRKSPTTFAVRSLGTGGSPDGLTSSLLSPWRGVGGVWATRTLPH